MNISYLNTGTRYIAPDIEVIHTSRSALERKLSLGETLYLQTLVPELKALKKQLYATDDCARQLLAASPASLQTKAIGQLMNDLQFAASSKSSVSAASTLENCRNEIKLAIDYSLSSISSHASALGGLLDNLREWTLADVTHFISDHESRRASLQKAIETLEARRMELQANKQRVNDAMRVYEDLTVMDRLIPILDDIMRIRPANPKMMALQAGVVGAKNILRIAAEMVRYEDLVSAQARAHETLAQQQAQLAEHRKQLSVLDARNGELRNLEGIENLTQGYEQEVRKLADALNTFLALRQNSDGPVEDFARTFITQADALSSWLIELGRKWK